MIGIVILPDKTLWEQDVTGLDIKRNIVGGIIEPVELAGEHTLWVHGEYLYVYGAEDFNAIASDVCGLGGRPDIMLRNPILGPAILVGPMDFDNDGIDTDITDVARNWVRRVAREAGGRWVEKP